MLKRKVELESDECSLHWQI